MTPIALGALGERRGERSSRADSGVLLMIAYGASIGGMATIIGTPPNLLVVGFLERLAGVRVTFAGWMAFAFPIALVLLVVSLVLTRLTIGRTALADAPARTRSAAAGRGRRGGADRSPLDRARLRARLRAVAAPSLVQAFLGRDHSLAAALVKHLPEAGVALLCARSSSSRP